jgi:hypothetical protein
LAAMTQVTYLQSLMDWPTQDLASFSEKVAR